MEKHLAGKVALVTGASRGVGKLLAFALGQLGCKIVLHARKLQNLQETVNLLKSLGAEYELVEGDLSVKNEVESVIAQVKTKVSQVDILYNNAALGAEFRTNIYGHPWEDWEQLFRANVFSLYTITAAFLPEMIDRGYGRVVNLTSGIKHQPQLAPYGATKAAVDKITDDLSIALPIGVRINTLDPGWLKTDMGGHNAEHEVWDVLPGALVPLFIDDDGPNGEFFSAIEYNIDIVRKFKLQDIKPA